jgi:EAL domain-containing protein (putative c-di-GMP-specific phosphodiesterase class I)
MADTCNACRNGTQVPFDFAMAFQPIIDIDRQTTFAHEALARGPKGQSAASVLSQVSPDTLYAFDQSARVKAIETAATLRPKSPDSLLSINILPNAVYDPKTCLRTSLAAATRVGFPPAQIIFEMTEQEEVQDRKKLKAIIDTYKSENFKTAIDDFGAGYSGLNLLAEFQPDIIKLDMDLVRSIDADKARRMIVSGLVRIALDMEIAVIAEGIETVEELQALRDVGIHLFQGYLFAKPALQDFPAVIYPA